MCEVLDEDPSSYYDDVEIPGEEEGIYDDDAPHLPPKEVMAAKDLELDRINEYNVWEDVLLKNADFDNAEWETTRWEVQWQALKGLIRARFVARQFKKQRPLS